MFTLLIKQCVRITDLNLNNPSLEYCQHHPVSYERDCYGNCMKFVVCIFLYISDYYFNEGMGGREYNT